MRTAPYADLHLHTRYSDGVDAPAALIRSVAQAGIQVAAVTDHDIVEALPEARLAGERHGVRVVAGVELSAERDGKEVHVLGLYVDEAHAGLAARLASFRAERARRARRIIERLRSLGIPLEYDALRKAVPDGGSLGRPHVARMLMEAGYVSSIPEAFDRYLAAGRPAHVGKAQLTPDEAVRLVREAGGLSFLAHPGPLRRDDWIPRLAKAGLDGIEAHHGDHDARAVRRYRAMADRLGLLVSGGSDYHGSNKQHAPIGSGGITREEFARIEAAAAARRAEARLPP